MIMESRTKTLPQSWSAFPRFRLPLVLAVLGATCLAVDAFSVPLKAFSNRIQSSGQRSRLAGCRLPRPPFQHQTPAPRLWTVLNQQQKESPDFISRDAKEAEDRIASIAAPPSSAEVVCDDFHGVCVLRDEPSGQPSWLEIWQPRLLLSAVCIAYGSNFACGSLMTEAMAPSAVAGLRFSLAAAALAPFLPRLDRRLLGESVGCSLFIAAAYIGQLVALQTVPAGKVGFLCCLSVVVCPLLDVALSARPLSLSLVASVSLALAGVASLELGGGAGAAGLQGGEAWALAQPVGFGVGYFLTERILRKRPDQALPVTAVQTATVGACSLAWMAATAAATPGGVGALVEGLGGNQLAGAAVLYTGLATTAATRVGETYALKGLSSSDAAVIMTTEPVWAAAWAWALQGEVAGLNAIVGGGLIMAACAANFAGTPSPLAPDSVTARTGRAQSERRPQDLNRGREQREAEIKVE